MILNSLNEDRVKAVSENELLLDHETVLSIRTEGVKVIVETYEDTFTYEGKSTISLLRQMPRGCFAETPELLAIYDSMEDFD